MGSESVKINGAIVGKVRKHVKKTRQTIGGYIEIAIERALREDQKPQEIKVPDWIEKHNKQDGR